MNNKQIPYDILARHIRQECTDDEQRYIENWISSSDDNKKLFEQLLHEWEYIYDSPEKIVYPDRNNIWDNIQTQLFASVAEASYSKKLLIKVCSVAAMIALIIGAATTLIIKSAADSSFLAESITTIETMQGQKMQMTLPDGTQVWLNSESKLTYSAAFNKSSREVNLEGEAFFDVKKNEKKKFIVKASNINVEVKGTAFDVSAYSADENIIVSLLRGKVGIVSKDGKHLTDLESNEMVVVSKKDLQYSLYKSDAETHRAWIENELIFYNSDIHQVAKKLERWYGINITLINPDEKQKYTFSVKTESLRELLELFNKITPIEYSIKGKEVTITHR
ncbi:FecR family protein [Dysgonomonas sp. HGC4]|uniref:FecR family protein n=1 Tax=Dysgonomonas sp. HGC4 TaxID=1658009 RepID=UPI000681221B|nr:FecR family protein [Dysgonomonas sp. HGC4]MBD8346708.1 FecR family protein [Dysgonomonas sp. HGC4]